MQKAASFSDISESCLTRVDIGGTAIVLLRDGEAVHAFQGKCPHAGAPLEEGAVCNGRIICPWHKATFDAATGALLEPPALEGLARHAATVENGEVWVSETPMATVPRAPLPDEHTLLMIGAGAAGAAAIGALSEVDFAGKVILVGREPGTPYDRTALSKFVVAGSMGPDEVPGLLNDQMMSHVETIEAEVIRLDALAKEAHLADGRTLAYSAALVAPGGEPKNLDVPGAHLGRVHRLRSRQDAQSMLGSIHSGAHAVVIGSSFIGLEVASGLREQQAEVTVVSPEEVPFTKQFGTEIGRMFKSLHEANGVKFLGGTQVARLEGSDNVSAVVLDNGNRLPADVVIVGVGVRPATDFIEGVRKNKDGGIIVDASMKAVEGLYVAGDAAAFPLAGKSIRIEHWRVAQQQGRIAAHNMLGGDEGYSGVPFFWTYHFGKRFEYLGHADEWDETVIQGSLETQDFVAFLVRGGMVAAVVACQRENETAILAERMRQPLSLADAKALTEL
jgi:NADPH-dependent 2,4-dienoyl-CoA reductase/sulfur reductase-like enzyme/nitrite reductase/ring-hydroxylating ferredoxin subunit